MTLDELENHPTSRRVSTETVPLPVAPQAEASHVFWVVGDDGGARRMIWTEDGRMVDVDEYGWRD